MITGFRHVGIVVRDLEKMLNFYKDILGLPVNKEMDEGSAFIDAILGLKNARLKTIKMNIPQGGMVELLYYYFPSDAKHQFRDVHELGITHFALTVSNLEQTYTHLLQNGIVFISSPQKSPDGGAKVAFCKDPEGNYIELVEVL